MKWPDGEAIQRQIIAEMSDQNGPLSRIVARAMDGLAGTPEDLSAMLEMRHQHWRMRFSVVPPMGARGVMQCTCCGKREHPTVSTHGLLSCDHPDISHQRPGNLPVPGVPRSS